MTFHGKACVQYLIIEESFKVSFQQKETGTGTGKKYKFIISRKKSDVLF